jgi:hypothetical protein
MVKTFYLAAILSMILIFACADQAFLQQYTGTVVLILNHYAGRNFTAGAISTDHLNNIIQEGIRSPAQLIASPGILPWHETKNWQRRWFSIVDGNVFIVVSAQVDGKNNSAQIPDCAPVVHRTYLAAQAPCCSPQIYTGQIDTPDNSLKTEPSLSSDPGVVAIVSAEQLAALREWSGYVHTVVIAVCHPAKETDIIRNAICRNIPIPDNLSALQKKAVPITIIFPQFEAFEGAIASCI